MHNMIKSLEEGKANYVAGFANQRMAQMRADAQPSVLAGAMELLGAGAVWLLAQARRKSSQEAARSR